MQGLVNFSTEIADAISVALPALCYLMACSCFLFAAWTLRSWAYIGHSHHHHFHNRPWVPFISLILTGVFATFPNVLTMATTSAGNSMAIAITSYKATTPGSASNVLGADPDATVINVVTMFQYFFEAFGAAAVFRAIVVWRSIVIGRSNGSPSACIVQFAFGVMCINILEVSKGVVALFETGG